jgi:hypothetical protein
MREHRLTTPELALVVAARGLAGLGLGLLLAGRLRRRQRRAVGITLIATGALLTIPIAWMLYGKQRSERAPSRAPRPQEESTASFAEMMAD